MRFFNRFRGAALVAALAAAFCLVAADFAEARRGGGFGSRGIRTFVRPAPTRTAPNEARPIDRSTTPREQGSPQAAQPASSAAASQARGGLFGGMAGGLVGGLMLGGLVGLLLGNGIGGLSGLLGLLLQAGVLILLVKLVMRLMRARRGAPAFAGAGLGAAKAPPSRFAYAGGAPVADAVPSPASGGDEIGLTDADLDRFEAMLGEIQDAFSREDHAALRRLATPEMVSFFSEEIAENAVRGVRNEVSGVRLLQGDPAEAWREDDRDYATVAMRYESVDVLRERDSGALAEGIEEPTEATEIWTFVRHRGGDWKLSAIQDT